MSDEAMTGATMLPRLDKAREALARRGDRELAAICTPMLDFLVHFFTPPTPEEVDARLHRIAEGDELAHAVARAAIAYLAACTVATIAADPVEATRLIGSAYRALERALAAYQEGMA